MYKQQTCLFGQWEVTSFSKKADNINFGNIYMSSIIFKSNKKVSYTLYRQNILEYVITYR